MLVCGTLLVPRVMESVGLAPMVPVSWEPDVVGGPN